MKKLINKVTPYQRNQRNMMIAKNIHFDRDYNR
jgi:hypothetical protein